MFSFDIESLFTVDSVDKSNDISVQALYDINDY